LELKDGFADDSGTPNPEMPTTIMVLTLTPRAGGGTSMATKSQFPSLEAMETMIEMGMEEGITEAMGQIEGILA